MIWFSDDITLAAINATSEGNMAGYLNIEYTELGDDYLAASMPVGPKTCQHQGLLSGGASVALAETVGSVAATLCVDRAQYYCLGLDINANHLRKVEAGSNVYAVAKPLHVGRTTHVWQIHITNEQGQLICASRLTVAVLAKKRAV
ncbi:MAG: hotdog fold thioesterase [Bacteroidota bacterium]